MDVRVSITAAVEALKAYREEHIKDYKEAVVVWREDVATYTKALEEWATGDAHNNRPYEPSRPRNYLGEYDKLIAKLGRHQDDTIKLNDNEYSIIFENKFYWQSQFQRQKAPIYTMGDASISSATIRSASISGSMLNADKIKLDGIDDLHVPLEDE